MMDVQQEVMCVLLRTLLDNELISQEVHDQARNQILSMVDWPEFFKEGSDGSA